MIIFKIYGGLGNQMFQYAAAKTLAERGRHSIYFEGSYFKRKEKLTDSWTYQLNFFKVECRELKLPEKNNGFLLLKSKILFKIYCKFFKNLRFLRRKYFIEKSLKFDSDFFATKENCYIEGYFQSYKYFEHRRAAILKDFTPVQAPGPKNQQLLNEIRKVNSVAVHFRRGDYVTSAAANKVHGICSVEYYKTAISKIITSLGNCHFFVFSDDIEWVKQNVEFYQPVTYVDHNKGDDSFWDLVLMSHCKHNIIANSTFSWWGAWLNQNDEKIIIAPAQWFADKTKDTGDLIPTGWVRL